VVLFEDSLPDGHFRALIEEMNLPVYLDEVLLEDPEIIFSVGTHSDAIRKGNVDFVRLVKPEVGSFAERFWSI
jgi:prolyl-tRNA editing enzyme YbaK/EbsC (Cys-tRNA(Pro) deacylase)